MSDHATDAPAPSTDDTPDLDHDARTGGPDVNTPDNEPDPHNPTKEDVRDKNR